jgi:hypothetical protein
LTKSRANSVPDPVGLLKIDVEGYEPQVFQGAREFFAMREPKLILFESLSGALDAGILEVLRTSGYRVFQLNECGSLRRARLRRICSLRRMLRACALLTNGG